MKEIAVGLLGFGTAVAQVGGAEIDAVTKYGFPAAFAILLGFMLKTVNDKLDKIIKALDADDLPKS